MTNDKPSFPETLKALSLFRSVIRSGEDWSDTCDSVYDEAIKELGPTQKSTEHLEDMRGGLMRFPPPPPRPPARSVRGDAQSPSGYIAPTHYAVIDEHGEIVQALKIQPGKDYESMRSGFSKLIDSYGRNADGWKVKGVRVHD